MEFVPLHLAYFSPELGETPENGVRVVFSCAVFWGALLKRARLVTAFCTGFGAPRFVLY